jgi:hypothetical protein
LATALLLRHYTLKRQIVRGADPADAIAPEKAPVVDVEKQAENQVERPPASDAVVEDSSEEGKETPEKV